MLPAFLSCLSNADPCRPARVLAHVRGAWIGLCVLSSVCSPQASRAEVWKCAVEGRVQYSDQPCHAAARGGPLASRVLQGNVIEVGRPAASASSPWLQAVAAAPDESVIAPAPFASVCPSDRDIASMETTASSITLAPEAKRFVQDEIRRARQCQKGQGRYSAADWAISRDAVAAQSSLTGAADARIRSESMHSAANPAEGDLIARRQEAELRFRPRAFQRPVPWPEWAPSGSRAGVRCAASEPCP